MGSYLFQRHIFLKDFKTHALEFTEQIRQATEQVAANAGRPVRYLASSSQDKCQGALKTSHRWALENQPL
jgi:hypothetical protein